MRTDRGPHGEDDADPDRDSEEAAASEPGHPHHDRHPHLIDADEDRWKWRAAIRRDPRKLFFYRIAVAVLGVLLMIAAVVTGPLPGPGGIPLFLAGLAVWASEFEWAQNVMLWFKARFEDFRCWPRRRKAAFWCLVAVCACGGLYLSMLFFGAPGWLPDPVLALLHRLPGVR